MLEGLNAERKRLTDQIFQGALAQIERDPSLLEHAALVLAHPSWPAGVIGIVASRLAERFNRPVVLLAAPPGQLARGSARSVEGCNISAGHRRPQRPAGQLRRAPHGGRPGHRPGAHSRVSPQAVAQRGGSAGRSCSRANPTPSTAICLWLISRWTWWPTWSGWPPLGRAIPAWSWSVRTIAW